MEHISGVNRRYIREIGNKQKSIQLSNKDGFYELLQDSNVMHRKDNGDRL